MAQINLLPWREQARQARKMRFGMTVLSFVCLGVFLVIVIHMYISHLIRQQNHRNAYIHAEIDKEEKLLSKLNEKKKEIIAIDTEFQFIVSLREQDYRVVRLLDELPRVVPETVTFNKLIRVGNEATIIGKTKSDTQITFFMKNIIKSRIFKDPVLHEISGKESKTADEKKFELKVKLQE